MNLQTANPQRLSWRPFTALPAPRRAPAPRSLAVRAAARPGQEQEARPAFAQSALVAAFLALSSAAWAPTAAQARAAEPAPKPTEFDELQRIVASRTGGAGSLLDSFRRAAPAAVQSQAATLAQTPAPAIGEVASEGGGPPTIELAAGGAAVAAILGIGALGGGGGGKKGGAAAAGKPAAAAKRAAKSAPAPLRKALAKAPKQAPAPVRRAAKQAPQATKRIKTAVAGTKRAGGAQAGTGLAAGTKRIAAAAQQPKRVQLDEDTATTVGAVGVVGLGVAVGGFLLLNALTGVEAPRAAPPAPVEAAARKLPPVPKPLPAAPIETAKEAAASLASSGPVEAAREAVAPQPEAPEPAKGLFSAFQKAPEPAPEPEPAAAAKEAAPEPAKGLLSAFQKAPEAAEAAAPEAEKAAEAVADAGAKLLAAPERVPTPETEQALPKQSAAFEAAAKRISENADAAEQFRAALADATKPAEPKQKPARGFASSAADSSAAASTPAPNQGALLLGGAAVVAGIAVIAAAPKDGEQPAGGAAPTGAAPPSGGSGTPQDIAARKQEAQQWIADWRQRTGGK